MSANTTTNPTEANLSPEQEQISGGDRNIGSSGANLSPNSHYIPLDECQCTICTEYFINAVETNCQHRFCNFCIHRWFLTHGRRQCPTCRRNVTHLVPLPSLDNSIQRMILSLTGDQILERERIRNRRRQSDNRHRNRTTYSRGPSIMLGRNSLAGLGIFLTPAEEAPLPLRLPAWASVSTGTNTTGNGNATPGSNNVTQNPELPESNANTNGNTTAVNASHPPGENNTNRRYIDEMTDTMNEYEYHLARAQAAHRRMTQARTDYETQETRLHALFNRFVTLSATAESTNEEIPTTDRNDTVFDSDLDDFGFTPNSRPSTFGLSSMNTNHRNTSENYTALDSQRSARSHVRSPWGVRPSLVTPPIVEQNQAELARQDRVDDTSPTSRFEPIIERVTNHFRNATGNLRDNSRIAATPLSSTPRRPTLNDVAALRSDITRNANQTRASYDRHISLRRAMSMNRRRLDQLRDERNRFQVQVDRLEAQTYGSVTNSTAPRDTDSAIPREIRQPRRTVSSWEPDFSSLFTSAANTNTNRVADDVNELWETFRTRVLRGQPQLEDSDSDEIEQPTRGNDAEESGSPQEEGDPESDPELRIEFRTPTMTLKMTNFSSK